MSDILNPLGGRFVGPSGPVAATSVLGTIPDPPRGLRQVDPGTIIKGVVLGRENDGLIAIATDKGTVRVASNATLPAGAQVTLEVRAAGDRLQVLILATDLLQKATTPQTGPGSVGAPQTPATQTPSPATGAGTQGTTDPRASTSTNVPATPAPAHAEQPSIQFVGSSLRAVVVHAGAVPADLPPPAPTPSSPPPTQAAPPAALPPQPSPAPIPVPPVQTAPIPAQPVPLPPQPPVQAPPQPAATPPVAQPPVPATPAPAAGIPPNPGPPVASPPPAPVPTGQVPPLPSGPIATVPVPTAPVPVTPTPPATSTPAPPLPTGTTPLPTGTAPLPPQNFPIPGMTSPVPLAGTPTTAATLQAAMLAAAEKKSGAVPPVTTFAPSTVAPALAAQEYADHDSLPNALPGRGQPALAAAGRLPLGTAFAADTRERILALFAAAGATPGETESITATAAQPKGTAAASPLPIGAELKLRVLAVQMQANQAIEFDPIAADPQDMKGQVIFGRVVAITPAGHAVIHTPLGDIMMQDRSSLVIGAKIALAIDTMEAAPPPAAIAVPMVQSPQQALLTLAQGWPTLADFIAVFQGAAVPGARPDIDPDVARQALAMLPHVGTKLAAGMMNAMAALRSGDIGKLLGPLFGAKGAGSEREEMVRRLKGEFSQLSALAQDRPEVDWRALFLPIIDDQGRITQVNLFYRRPKKGDADDRAGGGTGTRFVVEADFSKLGPFQLDGLMRKQRFDLMVRSRERLTDRMRLDIEAIYEEARGLTGFTGSIAFQTVDEFPVIPLDDLKRGTPTVMV